jgi:PAS domain S-box-containing protein
MTDVTEGRQTLRESQDLLRRVIDADPNSIFVKDRGGRYLLVNSAQAGLFDTTPDAMVGRTDADFAQVGAPAAQEAKSFFADDRQVIESKRPKFIPEETFTLPDGTIRWFQTTKLPLTLEDGSECVLGVAVDVTRSKQAEHELREAKEEAEQALAQLENTQSSADKNAGELAEALFQVEVQRKQANEARHAAEKASRLMNNILSSVGSIVIAVDQNGAVTQWNPAAEQAFALAATDVVGKLLNDCDIPWESTEPIEMIAACRDSESSQRLDEIRFTRPDGTTGLVSLGISPMTDENGEHAGSVLLADDVTERRTIEEELRQAQKLESVGALAAGIAHEINTPIQFVGDNTRFLFDSFAQLRGVLNAYDQLKQTAREHNIAGELLERVTKAEDDADLDYLAEEIPKAIDQTLDGVARVAKIVRAMKDFSHPDQVEKAPADLNHALDDTLTVARNELKYVADVVTDFDPTLPLVPCYLSDLNQVFLNLLVNAAHAIADVVGDGSKGKGTITVSTRHENDRAVIRVADTGTGIPEEARERVFDQFFTTKPVGRGTGQGLSIAHNVVVEKHGGSLTFDTEVGKGTTFIIRLPI